MLAWLSPGNARSPVLISYSSAPSAKMSVRASTARASSCSGAMYWSVPTSTPSAVMGVSPGARVSLLKMLSTGGRARPKSSSLAPERVSMTLAGLRSRWITPWRCARSSASAISVP